MPMRKSRGTRAQAFIVVLLSLFISMFVSLAVPPQPASAKRLEIDDLSAYLEQVFRQAYPDDEPGGAVLVVKDGETLLREGYGIADMELGVPVTPDMVFRLGSLTKQFTAVIVMMLVEEGALSLQDKITTHLPDYPPPAQVVTIEHLLTHTSGIPSYTDNSEVMASADQDRTVDEVIAIFEDEPLQFAPGSQWRYSNSGYFLLGAIIEAVTDMTYAEVIQERIFDPLEMRNSYYGNFEQIIPGRVRGYHHEGEIYSNAPFISMTMPYAAGSLLSTVDDLARWDAALHAGELLPREALERMWSAYTLTDGEKTGYGYGWMIADFDNKRVLQHGGGIHGFTTFALSVPEEKLYVAVLSNNPHTRHASTQWLAQKATSALLGQPLEWESVEVDSAILERYVGVYEIDPETERVVTVEDGKLFTQRTGGMKNQATPASETEFFYHHSQSHFRFLLDEAGNVTGMVMTPWGGQEKPARLTDRPLPEGPEIAAINPAVYDRYVGHYELMPGFVLTVTRDGDKLMVQATGQEAYQIFPTSETEFFYQVVDARITFVNEADQAHATSLVLHQAGQEMTAKRIE